MVVGMEAIVEEEVYSGHESRWHHETHEMVRDWFAQGVYEYRAQGLDVETAYSRVKAEFTSAFAIGMESAALDYEFGVFDPEEGEEDEACVPRCN